MVYAYISKLIKIVISYSALELSCLLRCNYIIGSKRLMFSGINVSGPLVKNYTSSVAFALFILRRLAKAYLFGMSLFNPLAYYIPTLIASGYWFSANRLIRLGVPCLAMLLFNLHPVGAQASLYSLYWLIPMVIHFLPVQIPFFEALGTTFTAHAVGSVLWLYSFSMPASYWMSLIPVVIVERLLFASGMTLVYYAMTYAVHCYTHVRNHFFISGKTIKA